MYVEGIQYKNKQLIPFTERVNKQFKKFDHTINYKLGLWLADKASRVYRTLLKPSWDKVQLTSNPNEDKDGQKWMQVLA